jgi:hypothetical protein
MNESVWVFLAVALPIFTTAAMLKTGEDVEVLDPPNTDNLTTVREGSRVTTRTVAGATPAGR